MPRNTDYMKKLRIVKRTNRHGQEIYFIQKRHWLLFWKWVDVTRPDGEEHLGYDDLRTANENLFLYYSCENLFLYYSPEPHYVEEEEVYKGK